MKRIVLAFALGLLCVTVSCDKRPDEEPKVIQTPTQDEEKPIEPKPKEGEVDPSLFAKPDASFVSLPDSRAERAIVLLKEFTPERALDKESLGMSEDEWLEVRDFTLKLLDPSEDKYKQFLTVLGWVNRNIKYKHGDNSAYATFRNRAAVCQGYSYLLKAMCHAIDIPVLIAHGDLHGYAYPHNRIGGHAWCYAYVDGEWLVADPTNRREPFAIGNVSDYGNALVLESFEGLLYEDDAFAYTYEDGMLTLHTIKPTDASHIVVPYGVRGVQVASFNPQFATVKQGVWVYLGENIRAIGVKGRRPENRAGNKYRMAVATENKYLENFHGTIYERMDDMTPAYIPLETKIYLKGETVVEKNRLLRHDKVETLVFGTGVERVDGDAVEKCPNLRTVYLPQSATNVASNAFSGSNYAVQVKYYAEGEMP